MGAAATYLLAERSGRYAEDVPSRDAPESTPEKHP